MANLKKIYQLRLQQTNDELVGYMLQLKAENKSDSQIWNEAQSYLCKKLGIIFSISFVIQTIYTTSLSLRKRSIRFLKDHLSKLP